MELPTERFADYTPEELLRFFRDWLGLPAALMLIPGKELSSLDKILLMRLRTAYHDHLASYPDERRLPHYDLKDYVADTYMGLDGLHIPLPARCVRPLRVKLDCWQRPVYRIQEIDSPAWKRQLYAYLGATPTEPQAFLAHNELILCGFPEPAPGTTPVLTMLECVAAPADGTFRIDPAHIPTLFTAA